MAIEIIGDRMATKALEGISDKLWNLRARLMTDIVDQHGAGKSLGWFARNMPSYERILKAWGPLRTHYLAIAVSATNGCAYCTYGHAYAFVLHHFEQTGELFPLSEHELRDLDGAGDVAQQLEHALFEADMAGEVPWLQRILAMQAAIQRDEKPATATKDDKRLAHLVEMFGFLNACGIAGNTEPDEAHDPINKNTDLRQRYDAARQNAASP